MKYTYEDLLSWPNTGRYELIEGIPRLMSASPDPHQAALAELTFQFQLYLRDKTYFLRFAPYDVFLFASSTDEPKDIDTVVQPDLVIICDRSKRAHKGCIGAPDLVIEIASESTKNYDRTDKLDLYEIAGVKEYWTVDLEKKKVTIYIGDNKVFKYKEIFIGDVKVPVTIFKDLQIDMGTVYQAAKEDEV